MKYIVYGLYSEKFDKIYIGYSSNIEARLFSHNSLRNKGWTKHFQPWELIYTEELETKAEAMKRESQLKSAQGRIFIRSRIKK